MVQFPHEVLQYLTWGFPLVRNRWAKRVGLADIDVGGDALRLGPAVRRGVDRAVASSRRPHDVVVVRQAATVAARQQSQQLRTNGILICRHLHY